MGLSADFWLDSDLFSGFLICKACVLRGDSCCDVVVFSAALLLLGPVSCTVLAFGAGGLPLEKA